MVRRSIGIAMVAAVTAIVAGCGAAAGPGGTPETPGATPAESATLQGSSAAAPSASPRPSSRPSPRPTPVPSPVDSIVAGVAVRSLALESNAAPIDVAIAFGSVWVANHHRATVTRLDPETMTTQATVSVGPGPGWFVVTPDAIWVSNQRGQGLTRIDPKTNTAAAPAGDGPTCGRPIYALRSLWQPACDANEIMRIDPRTSAAVDIPAAGRHGITLASGKLLVGGPTGLARLDPTSGTFTEIGGPDGWVFAFDGTTVWSSNDREVLRIRPADGSVAATIEVPETATVVFRGGHAWLPSGQGLAEIDLATSNLIRMLDLGPLTSVADGGDALWATSYDRNTVIRVTP